MSTEDCKYCNRRGLPLLPLRVAYLPEATDAMPAALGAGSPRLPGKFSNGGYGLRVITEGYVYTYDERAGGVWRCFAATASGHFRECELNEKALQPTPVFSCARQGDAEVASLISVENASEAAEVWVGYTRFKWTRKVRGAIKRDHVLRDLLMVKFNAGSVVKGGAVPADAGVRVASGAELDALVSEYGAFERVDSAYAKTTSTTAVNRKGKADPQVKAMQGISPHNAIVLGLPDVVGIWQDINHWRNLQAGELAKFQTEAKSMRTRLTGDLILGLEKSVKQSKQPEQWDKRYAQHLDMGKVRADKKTFDQKFKTLEKRVVNASADWVQVGNWKQQKLVWTPYRSDPSDVDTGLALERDMARCLFGSGGTKPEQAWWDQWLTAAPDDESHPLWLALAAGDKDVTAYMTGDAAKPADVGKTDKGVDIAKNSREAAENLHHWLKERREKNRVRSPQNESGLLATAIASQLPRMGVNNAEQTLVAGQRLRIAVVSRMDVVLTPTTMQVTMSQLVMQLHESVWGPPTTRMAQTVREARNSLKILQNTDGAWLGSRFSATKVVTLEVWVPDHLLNVKSAARALPAPGGGSAPVALPRPALNLWEGMFEYMKGLKGTGRGLVGLGAALQISNLSATMIQLKRATGGNAVDRDDAIKEAHYGIASGVTGVLGLTGEIVAGSVAGRVAPAVATTTATRLLTAAAWTGVAGGMLGVISSTIDGAYLWGKADGLELEGDKDAMSSYRVASVFSYVAAVAGASISIITAGLALTAAGATGTLAAGVIAAGSVLSFIPVFGWIVIVVGFIAAGIYMAYKASTEEDTPLEKWLSRCYYRNEAKYKSTTRKPFADLKEELSEFQLAIYGLSISFTWSDGLFGKDTLEVKVVMPGYSARNSDYAFYLSVSGPKWKNTVLDRRSSTFSTDVDLKPQPPQQTYVSASTGNNIPAEEVLEITQSIKLDVSGGTGILSGIYRINDQYFTNAKLKFEYRPDVIDKPELLMIPVPGGSNFVQTGD